MIRIGSGYDIHKLVRKKNLILCGVKIESKKGLLGHSDADVATHALIDSLLGAANLGNIGLIFSDSEPEFKNIQSLKLLKKTNQLLTKNNFKIVNIDLTIIAQQPKLNPHINLMKHNLSEILKINENLISIKPKTNEFQDSIGKNKAIAAFCSCLIETI